MKKEKEKKKGEREEKWLVQSLIRRNGELDQQEKDRESEERLGRVPQ